ncbi:hypothetical protein DB30_01916 [Enhygromyxa salina]|uniref:Uncharacterized protein n=1 Tax=Enhygromyxa salina TaxID=215803 RepID=A0A0C1ZKI7_9BACT|nr:hypothetical protein DB30_01916 [Enhygromyxa salina]
MIVAVERVGDVRRALASLCGLRWGDGTCTRASGLDRRAQPGRAGL